MLDSQNDTNPVFLPLLYEWNSNEFRFISCFLFRRCNKQANMSLKLCA